MKLISGIFCLFLFCHFCTAQSLTDTLVLRDIEWDKYSHASMIELQIPSNESLIQGFMYKANGGQKHPTLLLLHGFPGNERNLDLAQIVRAHGWNVVYFNYRGAWGSQGKFGFENCVQDVVNVVEYCKKNQDYLQIDTSRIVLFGHSMGGWVCLKALEQLPGVKKGFALSTWDIYSDFKKVQSDTAVLKNTMDNLDINFVLNSPAKELFMPFSIKPEYFNLTSHTSELANKQIIMLDEHTFNKKIADAIKKDNTAYFEYQVWQTDHPFTNKRVALTKLLLAFLDK